MGQVISRFAFDAGNKREDLAAFAFRLGPDEVERIERLAVT